MEGGIRSHMGATLGGGTAVNMGIWIEEDNSVCFLTHFMSVWSGCMYVCMYVCYLILPCDALTVSSCLTMWEI